jgi:hypothetical protein
VFQLKVRKAEVECLGLLDTEYLTKSDQYKEHYNHSHEAKEVISHMSHLFKQKAMKKTIILLNYCVG